MFWNRSKLLLVVVAACLFLGLAAWQREFFHRDHGGTLVWEIKVNNRVFATGELEPHGSREELYVPLPGRDEEALVVFEGGSIFVPRLPSHVCPDGACTRMGPISRPGENIVCMPNRMLIRIYEKLSN